MAHRPRLPNWPRRMKADLAAAYMGVSRTKFLAKVSEQDSGYPSGHPDGGNTLWYREDLDEALDRMKNGDGHSQSLRGAVRDLHEVKARQAGSV